MTKTIAEQKARLRRALRRARREHVANLPPEVRALVFRTPPSPIRDLIAPEAVIGLYHATSAEARASSYARFFHEKGYRIGLPWIAAEEGEMDFGQHSDPYGYSDLEPGPRGILQPGAGAAKLVPEVLFVPVLGFTSTGARLGQGGGHYDRWLASHPARLAIGLAWDVQRLDSLPQEDHDMTLGAIITPSRLYGPF